MDHKFMCPDISFLVYWSICCRWKSCLVSPSFALISPMPAPQYLMLGGPSLGNLFILGEIIYVYSVFE